MIISENSTVTIEYCIKDENGSVLDSSREREMPVIRIGECRIFGAAEKKLIGRHKSDLIEFWLDPADAFGEYDCDSVVTVPRKDFGNITEIKRGMQLQVASARGTVLVSVIDYDNSTVTVDANHPYAGKRIKMEIFVVDVSD